MVDTTPTYTQNVVNQPLVDALILSNADVKASGNSSAIYIGNAKHVDVLTNVGAETGTSSLQVHLTILGGDGSTVIKTYDGVAITASNGTDVFMVDSSLATSPLGTYVKVTWDGTLSNDHWFAGVYIQLVAK